ncbi:MAG: MBL fold metallo-hydrolase, partial [Planctomycetota bacterium]
WLSELKTAPKKLFVVHGESENARSFGDYVREKLGWLVTVPDYSDEVILD